MTQDIRTALAGLLAAHVAICRDAGIDPTINVQYREARALLATPAPLSDEPVAVECRKCFRCGHDAHLGQCVNVAPTPSDKQEAVARSLGVWTITKPKMDGSGGYETYETSSAIHARAAGMHGWSVSQHLELLTDASDKQEAKPIYQVLEPCEDLWSDADWLTYERTDGAFKRIVYAAPLANPSDKQEIVELRERIAELERDIALMQKLR